jgi:hypothetical protein
MRMLSDAEAFDLMNRDFEKLSNYDVIDVCNDDDRFPAAVVGIDRPSREFTIIPLYPDCVKALLAYGGGERIIISLPSSPLEVRPRWSNVTQR